MNHNQNNIMFAFLILICPNLGESIDEINHYTEMQLWRFDAITWTQQGR